MPEAYIVDAVRTPGRAARRRPGAGAPRRPRRARDHARSIDRTGVDPAAVDDVVFGCVDTIGPQAGDIARTCWLVGGPARGGAGHDRRPAVRLVAAGRALRRAGRDARHVTTSSSPAACRTCRMIPISVGDDRRASRSASTTRSPARRAGSTRYGTRRCPVPRRRDDRREVGHHPRRHGGVRGRVARARAAGQRRGPLRARDRAARRRSTRDEGPARAELGQDPLAAARSSRAAGSPPRCRRRSPTRRPRCSIASEQARARRTA